LDSILQLQPNSLWKHFADICSIPHPSKHEEAICLHIISFAKKHNLEYKQDAVGNILITKKATHGFENREIVCLQAHVDMVPQKNAEIQHNFITDSIKPFITGNFVKATQTTLGADNGIGLAAILAVLGSDSMQHGPLEALFTIDEETGMTGANNLTPDFLQAKYLINTDTEVKNEITVGCAGGLDGNFIFDYTKEQIPNNYISYQISISGLTGGHSGFEIHLGRANANVLLSKLLQQILPLQAQISSINGGNMRNAIPRESSSIISIPANKKDEFTSVFEAFKQSKIQSYSSTDPYISLSIQEITKQETCIANKSAITIIEALLECPNEVITFENKEKGIVRTSTNLSIIKTHDNSIEINCLLRSFSSQEKQELANRMEKLFSEKGATTSFVGDYPGWEPIWDSKIIDIVKKASTTVYKTAPHIQVVHAGLECGIFSGIFPNIEYVSFGPTIRNPHSPDELVEIDSVHDFWKVLCLVLEGIPETI
jgi:dipeptidase D